jgi:hypothetical protein
MLYFYEIEFTVNPVKEDVVGKDSCKSRRLVLQQKQKYCKTIERNPSVTHVRKPSDTKVCL